MHLLTVTPNPAIDQVVEVPVLEWGDTAMATSVRRAAGGKGINMARVAVAMGHQATAIYTAGGAAGRFLTEELELNAGMLTAVPVGIRAETRTNTVLHAPTGRSLKVNLPGPTLNAAEADALVDVVLQRLPGHSAVALAGSLPAGFSTDHLTRLLTGIRAAGVPLLADLQADALLLACALARPLLIKPNIRELGEALGRPLPTERDALEGARELVTRGARNVALTDGPRAAYLITATSIWKSRPAPISSRTMSGMGDAFGTGFVAAKLDGMPDEECLSEAMAWGGAVAQAREADLLTADQVDLVRRAIAVERLE